MSTDQIINTVLAKMSDSLSSEQLTLLEATLIVSLRGMRIEQECTELAPTTHSWDYFLPRFRATKRLKNCTESTLKLYEFALNKLRTYIPKAPQEITTSDIKLFLALYGDQISPVTKRKPSKSYINNLKNQLSSFFDWMQEDGFINRNPCDGVPKIKVPKTIKRAYSGEEMEAMKALADNDRDKALIYFLDATGVRISEAISIDIDQIQWDTHSMIIYGSKGKAERMIMFTEECGYWLKKYLDGRKDDNAALFVQKRKPYNRLTKSGAEQIIRDLGKQIGIHAHPHRFRRTMITRCNRRGMNLQEIQMLAGHANSQTTQIYIDMQRDSIKSSYERLS